jgi:uncharacterized cupredoxin-like copper-binding protein
MKLISPSRTLSAAAVVVVALAVAGCGSSSKKSSSTQSAAPATTTTQATPAPSSGGGGGAKLKVSADPSGQLKFDKTSLTAKAGKVTLTESNPSSVPHGIALEGQGQDKDGPTGGQGSTSSVTLTLKPGKYQFYCPVPGHKQAGMQGTLTVQ